MSSEMRKLIRKEVEQWVGITRNRDIERSARVWMEGYDAALTYCADRISALLARTEAGADLRGGNVRFDVRLKNVEAGADGDGFLGFVHECVWEDGTSRTIYEKKPSLLRERPGLTSQRIVRAYTHPQDASGDAGFSAKELHMLGKCVTASVTLGGHYIPEGWNALLDKIAAMQAKEAK